MSTDIVPAEQSDEPIGVGDFMELIAQLAAVNAQAAEVGEAPRSMAAGTFALYPMPDGGLMFVSDIADGPLAGVKHTRIAPGMIRAAVALAGGGSKLAAVKSLIGRGK